MPEYLRVSAVADRLGIKPDKVLAWIAAGHLAATNVSDGKRRPRWRIDPAALERFLLSRASRPAAPIRRRRAVAAPGHQWF